jgi:hypothetical protein
MIAKGFIPEMGTKVFAISEKQFRKHDRTVIRVQVTTLGVREPEEQIIGKALLA